MMKRILQKIAIVLTVFGFAILSSCEEPYVAPDCEVNDYGSVKVQNNTGYVIYVDVTWRAVGETNYEKRVSIGSSTTYSRVPAGNITCWVSFDGEYWDSKNEYLARCEDMTYSWYLVNKKSASVVQEFYVEVTDGDGNLIKTLTQDDFQKREK